MSDTPFAIVGGGPAGLAAAIALSRAGRPAHVFERREAIGARFHGDFQGLENWSTATDVLEELGSLGISPTFGYRAFRECTVFDHTGRTHLCRSERPIWYQVRRGSDTGTLDHSLLQQATAAGVTIECNRLAEHLPGAS